MSGRDTNYTNYHEGYAGFGDLVHVGELRTLIGAHSGDWPLSSCEFVKFVSAFNS
jgi:hypothetical protein